MVCKSCGIEKPESEYYPYNKSKCRKCVLEGNLRRYYEKHQARLKAGRLARRRKTLDARQPRLPVPSPVECAYAAGLIDGEGNIGLLERGRRGGKTFRVGQYTLLVYVVNTNKEMVDWVRARWGGHAQYVPPKPELNRRANWRLQIQANRALRLLDDIYPYLVAKRPQAKLARRFQRYVQVSGRARTDKVARVQKRFWWEMRVMNHRGLRPISETEKD